MKKGLEKCHWSKKLKEKKWKRSTERTLWLIITYYDRHVSEYQQSHYYKLKRNLLAKTRHCQTAYLYVYTQVYVINRRCNLKNNDWKDWNESKRIRKKCTRQVLTKMKQVWLHKQNKNLRQNSLIGIKK